MERIDAVPVDQSKKSQRIEDGRLANRTALFARSDLKFEPGTSGQLHFGVQPQTPWRFVKLHAPEVERIADAQLLGITAASSHADAAHEQVQETAQRPQPVTVVPAGATANAANRRERLLRRNVDRDGSRIDES